MMAERVAYTLYRVSTATGLIEGIYQGRGASRGSTGAGPVDIVQFAEALGAKGLFEQ